MLALTGLMCWLNTPDMKIVGICFEQVKEHLLPNQDLRLRIVAEEVVDVVDIVEVAEAEVVVAVVAVVAAENRLAPFVAGSC